MIKTADIIRKTGQKFYKRTLSNGLNVCFFPKPDYQKKFAMYAVNFGAQDCDFSIDGKRHRIPAGMAHFLEHKVFEQKDGDALQKFSAIGASPNAFTSQTMTAYHFECTDRFFDNLKILLEFVNNPYFTEQNVAKEQGIIGQEIGMVNDSADWVAYVDLFAELFPDRTIRESVIGTVESIAQITPEMLYMCHGAFYRPENMVLTVAGDVDFDKICDMAEQIVKKTPAPITERFYETGDKRGVFPKSSKKMEVSLPVFLAGFRDCPPARGADRQVHMLMASIAAEYLCGQSSPLFAGLYAKNLLERDFGAEYTGALIAGGESREPERVFAEMIKAADRVRRGDFDKKLFVRLVKSFYGMQARCLNSVEALCQEQAEAHFAGTDFLDFPGYYDRIGEQDIIKFISEKITEQNAGVSVIYPAKNQNS